MFQPSDRRLALTPVSAAILGLFDGTRNVRGIASAVAKELDQHPGTIRKQVRGLAAATAKLGLTSIYDKSSFPPLIVLPTGTSIASEIDAAVRYRMGRFYARPAAAPESPLPGAPDEHHLLLKFSNRRLVHPGHLQPHDRKSLFIQNLLKLEIPDRDFAVLFNSRDTPEQNPCLPIHSHFRISGSDANILWPLNGYTSTDSVHFGRDIDASDRPWEQKTARAVWRGTTTGISVNGMTIDEIDSLISRPLIADDSVGGRTLPKANRLQLVSRYHDAAWADIGLYSFARIDAMAQEYFRKRGFLKAPLSVRELLSCKYLIVVDGNSYATQLPWSLHSQSLVLMAEPAWETIISGVAAWQHYVPLAADFSDLEEKLEWCRRNDGRCRKISRRATELMRHYYNPARERLVQQRLLEQYVENYESW